MVSVGVGGGNKNIGGNYSFRSGVDLKVYSLCKHPYGQARMRIFSPPSLLCLLKHQILQLVGGDDSRSRGLLFSKRGFKGSGSQILINTLGFLFCFFSKFFFLMDFFHDIFVNYFFL